MTNINTTKIGLVSEETAPQFYADAKEQRVDYATALVGPQVSPRGLASLMATVEGVLRIEGLKVNLVLDPRALAKAEMNSEVIAAQIRARMSGEEIDLTMLA